MNSGQKKVVFVARRALLPIARLFVHLGIGVKHFENAARLAFLDAAVDHLSKRGKPISIRSLADTAGMPKNTVTRLSAVVGEQSLRPSLRSSAAFVISEWATNPAFTQGNGSPCELPLKGAEASLHSIYLRLGCAESFSSVVEEMRGSGAIEVSRNNNCKLLSRAHIQRAMSDSAIYHFSRTLYTIGETLVSNVTGGASDSRLFERASFTYGLNPLALPKFIQLSGSTSANFLELVDEWISVNEDKGLVSTGNYVSGVGVYAFHARVPDDSFDRYVMRDELG